MKVRQSLIRLLSCSNNCICYYILHFAANMCSVSFFPAPPPCALFHTQLLSEPASFVLTVTLIFVVPLFPWFPQRGYGDGGSYQGQARNRYRVSKSSNRDFHTIIFIRIFCILLYVCHYYVNMLVEHNDFMFQMNNIETQSAHKIVYLDVVFFRVALICNNPRRY